MLSVLETILWPIIYLLQTIFLLFEGVTGSAGISIILLSITASVLLLPVQRWGQKIEGRVSDRLEGVNKETAVLKKTMKGEELFFATEEVYKRHGYHPIQSVMLGASFMVLLPVLISALLLFTQTPLLDGKSFLIINDLSKPDGLLGPINVLPILMSAVTVFDANIRFKEDKSSKYRFYIIAIVLLVLVYTLPSGLALYWATSNLIAAQSSIRKLFS